MRLFYFASVLVFLTWVLLWIGGLVNPMGASLACPDWYFVPTCNGELLPAMTGGVLFEHGHRLWASLVGCLTLILALGIWFSSKTDKITRLLALLAVFSVALQGTLGGLTVLLGLNATLSTLHLVVAMGFFCLLVEIARRLLGGFRTHMNHDSNTLVWIAFGMTFAQILLGGLIRHVGAGMACGNDWISCGPTFWPSWDLGQLHMLHRLLGYLVAVVIAWVFIKQRGQYSWAWVPFVLVLLQIALGLWTVAFLRPPYVVAMHTAVGALTLGSLWILGCFSAIIPGSGVPTKCM